MSTAAAAVDEFFPHYFPFLGVLVREHGLVAQLFAAATAAAAAAAAAPFPAVATPRVYRP